jgi:mono/diheme cytochrome c family protein
LPTRIIALAIVAWLGTLTHVVAQAPAAARIVTTDSGVYTSAQAARGEQTYMNICIACHPTGTYSAPAFREKWDGSPLSELFGYVSTAMPKLEPGSLEPDEYAQVIAYMLKINGAPAGKSELPADAKALKRIRISMPKK